jgi:aspartokinase/homoserine dehydrogenase 1
VVEKKDVKVIILKFGGSSVRDEHRIKTVIEIIGNIFNSKERGAVVFSAYQGVTDSLISAGNLAAKGDKKYLNILEEIKEKHLRTAKSLTSKTSRTKLTESIKPLFTNLSEILHGIYLVHELTAKTQDFLMSFGERLSSLTISFALREAGIHNEYLDARSIIKTDKSFGGGRVNYRLTNKNIRQYFNKHKILQIVTGFIASTDHNETITLGRGGSDLTASILGAALDAKRIELWTDVNGVLTVDPRKVKNFFPIEHMTYEEAMELSHFGAKVIYPPTIQPALSKKIPILIKNTLNPSFKGTYISKKHTSYTNPVRGISSIDDITLIRVQGSGMVGAVGIAERMFSALAKKNINIILITQASSEHSVCFAIPPKASQQAVESLKEEFRYEIRDGIINEIKPEKDFSIVAVVGENMRHTPGIAGKVFQTLGSHSINISAIAQGSSERIISAVIEKRDEAKALNALHDTFFHDAPKVVNLYMVGTGLIGSTFLQQLKTHINTFYQEYNMSLRLAGLANIDKMHFDSEGIQFDTWEDVLNSSGKKMSIDRYINKIRSQNLSNCIFIDCTASKAVAERYQDIIASQVSIVAANKIANSSSKTYYEKLRKEAKIRSVQFLYETNVGSAMPIIDSIKTIVATGDKVTKIEGILSGTLSYIFNIFSENCTFSESVLQAKNNGYTEPDPRDDLNGLDAGRKLLILIREAGYSFNFKDVAIQNLIPKRARKVKSVDEFLKILKNHDDTMEKIRLDAQKDGKVLRYVASFENGKAKTSLQQIGKDHPFFMLKGSDNIVSIFTRYYNKNPLTIRGPGAGADITAAGVLSDVLKIAKSMEA